ncbi:MAG: RNA polymerase sigma factor [Myxococcota bacterium]
MTSAEFDFERALAAARRGDSEGLTALFERFHTPVRRIVHRRLAAEVRPRKPWLLPMFSTGDIVQDTFQRVLADLSGFEGRDEGAFVGYLASAVRHRIVDSIRFHEAMRRDSRRTSTLSDNGSQSLPTADEASVLASHAEEARILAATLSTLEARERELLRARFEDGDAFELIAERLLFPSADAARKASHRLVASLLVRLRRAGLGEGSGDPGGSGNGGP